MIAKSPQIAHKRLSSIADHVANVANVVTIFVLFVIIVAYQIVFYRIHSSFFIMSAKVPPLLWSAPSFQIPSIKQQHLQVSDFGLRQVAATELQLGKNPTPFLQDTGSSSTPSTSVPVIRDNADGLPQVGALYIPQPLGVGLQNVANSDIADEIRIKITSANDALQIGNWEQAEYILGRKLTSEEVTNRTVSPELRSVQPPPILEKHIAPTNPSVKGPERLPNFPVPPIAPSQVVRTPASLPQVPPSYRRGDYGSAQRNLDDDFNEEKEEKNDTIFDKAERIVNHFHQTFPTFNTTPFSNLNEEDQGKVLREMQSASVSQSIISSHSTPVRNRVRAMEDLRSSLDWLERMGHDPNTARSQRRGRGQKVPATGGKISIGHLHIDGAKLGRGVLSVSYAKSGRKVPGWKNSEVTPKLARSIMQLSRGETISGRLSADEKQTLGQILHRSKQLPSVPKWLKPTTQSGGTTDPHRRLTILLGEMEAGNDSPYLKRQVAQLMKRKDIKDRLPKEAHQLIHQTFLS